ncbi:MAG TPA: hypothetical protein VEG27_09275 [Usitatibacter sp.]|nr:hypothetical protein [Usitatibacter sp.]
MPALRPLAVALAAALPALACAGETLTIYSRAAPGSLDARSLGAGSAIPGYAVVREERPFALAAGRNLLRVDDVPELIDPTTVAFASLTDPAGTRVVEQSFEFDLTSSAKLLSRYLGREITVERARGDGVESITGTLVGTQGGLTLKLPDGSVAIVQSPAGIRLPSLPGGLVSKPALAWDVEATHSGTHRTEFSYQTGGMTWWADYNLAYSEARPGSCRVDVGAWVTIVNQSGASFPAARVKLVAGDVHRAAPPGVAYGMVTDAPEALRAAKSQGFVEKAFFEYHLYTLGRTTSLAQNSTKQIELFPAAPGVGCEKTLVYQGQAATWGPPGAPLVERGYGVQSNRKVDIYLRLGNSASNGLGVPLPAGRVRVSRRDEADGALEFVGEDVIDHTPRDETVQVRLGSAFDVVGERRQTDFRLDGAARWMEEDIEVRVRNHKDEAVPVIVRESLYRWSQWRLVRHDHDFTKEDSRTVDFPLRVAAHGEAVVRYTVRYTW